MAAPPITPLSDARHKEINTALGRIIQTRELLQKAERAGMDFSAELAELAANEAMFNALKAEFFPDRP